MKLIGSKTERDYREELLASNKSHFSGESPSRLNEALRNAGYETKNAYVLHWTPDQAEDFFTVLVEGLFLVAVEIDRYDTECEVSVKRYELADYIKGLSRMHHVRLLVAQELAHGKT
jgi:hypothetical protein